MKLEKDNAEKDFCELKKNLDEGLDKVSLSLGEKKLDWQSSIENLTMAFEAMPPEQQDRHRRNYTDLIEELDHWKDLAQEPVLLMDRNYPYESLKLP